MLSKKLLIEFVGTFLLVFVAIATHSYLAIGATLAAILYLGHGVYNPAIMATYFAHASPNYMHIVAMMLAEFIGGMLAFMANSYM